MSTTANTARAHKADAQKAGQTAIEEAVASRPFGHSLSDLPARLVIPHLAKWHRVVGIGDSVDEGMWDGIDPTVDWRRFENQQEAATTPFFGWGDRLAGHLSRRRADAGLSPVLYANLAVRGKLIDYIVSTEVPEALDLHPDLVLMDGGGNDVLRPGVSISRVLRYIEYGVRRIRRTGADVIFLLAAQPGERLEFARKKMADYNVRVKSLADELDFYVVDTWAYTPMSDPRLWSQDGIHPSSEGHERIAQMALVGLGLDPDPAWAGGELSRPLPGRLVTRTDKMSTSRKWLREYAVPWVGRRLTGTSSGDGRTGKRPDLIVMPPSAPHPGSALLQGRPAAPHPYGPSAEGWLSDEEIRSLHAAPDQLAALREGIEHPRTPMGEFGEPEEPSADGPSDSDGDETATGPASVGQPSSDRSSSEEQE